jgi:hypothetical protein
MSDANTLAWLCAEVLRCQVNGLERMTLVAHSRGRARPGGRTKILPRSINLATRKKVPAVLGDVVGPSAKDGDVIVSVRVAKVDAWVRAMLAGHDGSTQG